MRLPRKAILIRLCIYIPLLAFFGWQAYKRFRTEQEVKNAAPEIEGVKRTITGPDGKPIEYFEITEDQAKQMGWQPEPKPATPPADAPRPTTADPPADAKAPAPAAPGAN
jgi:hypothetical protein